MQSAAWSFLLNGYSPDFLNRQAKRLPLFIEAVAKNNSAARLSNLIRLNIDQGGKLRDVTADVM